MSQGQDRDERHDDGDVEDAPMLVLGERGPDVEDTTLEELRRQREELLREREEAQERIRAERERAEEELAERRRRTEQELIERQRQIDDAERDLLAAERRVRRQAERSGKPVPKVTRSRTPLPPRGRMRAQGLAGLLAVVVAITGVIALVQAGSPPSDEQIQDFATLAEGQLAWDEAGRAYDELIVTRMQSGGSLSDAEAAAVRAQADEVIELLDEADRIAPRSYVSSTDRTVAAINTIADSSTSAIRAVNLWDERRYDMSAGAVSSSDLRRASEAMTPGSAASWWMLVLMVLAVGWLIRLAIKDRAYVALALLAVAGVTGVSSMVFLGSYQQGGPLNERLELREDAYGNHREGVDALRRDLSSIYGVRSSGMDDETYWTTEYFVDLDSIPPNIAQDYRDVRAGFLDLSPDEQLDQTPELVEALEPVWLEHREQLSAANDAVVEAAHDAPGVTALALTTLGTVGLAAAAIFVPSHRPDRLRTSSTGSTQSSGRGSGASGSGSRNQGKDGKRRKGGRR